MNFTCFNTAFGRRVALGLLLGSALASTACGGGGGGSESDGGSRASGGSGNSATNTSSGAPTPPTQSSRTAALGGTATGLAANSSLVLQNNGAPIGTVSADGAFSFAGVVNPGSPYHITVQTPPSGHTCSVGNGSGMAGANDIRNITVSCESMVKSWRTAQLIEFDAGSIEGGPNIATDPKGNSVAVWIQSDGTRRNAWFNRYSAATQSWGTPALLETGEGNAEHFINPPSITTDSAGNIAVAWVHSVRERDGFVPTAAGPTPINGDDRIRVTCYIAATGSWSGARFIDEGLPLVGDTTSRGGRIPGSYAPQLVFDSSGNVTVVWTRFEGGSHAIWSNRYVAATASWSAPRAIQPRNPGANFFFVEPAIAVDPSGDVVAVWSQTSEGLTSSRYSVLAGMWSAPAVVDSMAGGRPRIAIDRQGNAFVVSGSRSTRYVAATGRWEPSQQIVQRPDGTGGPTELVIDSSETPIALWSFTATGEAKAQLLSSRFSSSAGAWNAPAVVDSRDRSQSGIFEYKIAADTKGNAVAVWSVGGPNGSDIWSGRYNAATQAWGPPVQIETGSGSARSPQLATDPLGNVVATWVQQDAAGPGGLSSVWSNSYQ